MGCLESTESDAEKARHFKSFVFEKNALALALQSHWDAFMRENEYLKDSDDAGHRRLKNARKSHVDVNRSVSEAQRQKLDYPTAKKVCEAFLGYAMESISDHRWGGSVRFNIRGAAEKESNLAVSGSVSFNNASGTTKITSPYAVDMRFFLCRE